MISEILSSLASYDERFLEILAPLQPQAGVAYIDIKARSIKSPYVFFGKL